MHVQNLISGLTELPKKFSSTPGRMDTQHKGISLYLILPSDHTTFTRSHSDESAPFAKLWFLKRNPLTFLPRSSNECCSSIVRGSYQLYIHSYFIIFHLWVCRRLWYQQCQKLKECERTIVLSHRSYFDIDIEDQFLDLSSL